MNEDLVVRLTVQRMTSGKEKLEVFVGFEKVALDVTSPLLTDKVRTFYKKQVRKIVGCLERNFGGDLQMFLEVWGKGPTKNFAPPQWGGKRV